MKKWLDEFCVSRSVHFYLQILDTCNSQDHVLQRGTKSYKHVHSETGYCYLSFPLTITKPKIINFLKKETDFKY